jgi:hypothetical protein
MAGRQLAGFYCYSISCFQIFQQDQQNIHSADLSRSAAAAAAEIS